ncbi:MAG: response regulator [Actinobacteria bacterium]|nr:response regulator [Actinomycetota bacterium]
MAENLPCKNHPSANVLLVDQQDEVRDFLLDLVASDCGCSMTSASTASGAVLRISQEPFDLVLTNLSLPDADGKWLVQKIHQQHPNTGIIAISQDSSPSNIIEALRAGADDFLIKPLDAPVVVERINHLLSRAKTDRSNDRWRRRTAGHLKRLRNRRQRLAEQVELVCQDLVGGYRRTVEKLLELQTQQDCREAIEGVLEMKSLLANILRYLSNTFNGASGAVFLFPLSRAQARLFTPIGGGPPANIDEYDQDLIQGIIRCALHSRTSEIGFYGHTTDELMAAEAASALGRTDSDISEDTLPVTVSPRSLLASGLYIRQRTIGAVVMQRKNQHPFTAQEAKLLNGLSSPLARAIDVALRLESAEPEHPGFSQTDPN